MEYEQLNKWQWSTLILSAILVLSLIHIYIYGNKYDMMDGVDLPNDSGNVGKWRIWMPDGLSLIHISESPCNRETRFDRHQ